MTVGSANTVLALAPARHMNLLFRWVAAARHQTVLFSTKM